VGAWRKIVSAMGLQFQVVDQKEVQPRRSLETEVEAAECLVLMAEVQEKEVDFLAWYSRGG
jgi:hypothetical protein